MSEKLDMCPICGGSCHERIYLARDRHYGISGEHQIVRCKSCSLVFLNPMYTDQELSAMYPPDYYAYQPQPARSRLKEGVRKLLRYETGTKEPKFAAPGRVLDVGCGTGWFLRKMRMEGWETYGVEISEMAARIGREQEKLNIFAGSIWDAQFPSDYFDYVRSNHSFEHMTRPNETLREMFRVLKPNGKLMIGVPNVDSLNANLFKQYWWYLGAPVHAFNYSVTTLTRLLEKHNFEIERIVYNSDFSGLLGSIQIRINNGSNRKSTDGALMNNSLFRYMAHRIVKLFDRFHRGDAIEITATKRDARCGKS